MQQVCLPTAETSCFWVFIFLCSLNAATTPGTIWNIAALSGSKLVWRIVFFCGWRKRHIKAGFNSGDGVGVVSGVAYDQWENQKIRGVVSRREGIRVGRIRTFPFSSDSSYDSIVYDLVKTKLSEYEAKAAGKNKPIIMHARTLCDWFSSSASASDSDNPIFTWSLTTES